MGYSIILGKRDSIPTIAVADLPDRYCWVHLIPTFSHKSRLRGLSACDSA